MLIACRDFHDQSDVILIQFLLILLIAACGSLACVCKCGNVGVKPARVRVQRQGQWHLFPRSDLLNVVSLQLPNHFWFLLQVYWFNSPYGCSCELVIIENLLQ